MTRHIAPFLRGFLEARVNQDVADAVQAPLFKSLPRLGQSVSGWERPTKGIHRNLLFNDSSLRGRPSWPMGW